MDTDTLFDYLTKWVEAVAVPNQTAEIIAKLFVEEIFCRLCYPELPSKSWSGQKLIKRSHKKSRSKQTTATPASGCTTGPETRYVMKHVAQMQTQNTHVRGQTLTLYTKTRCVTNA